MLTVCGSGVSEHKEMPDFSQGQNSFFRYAGSPHNYSMQELLGMEVAYLLPGQDRCVALPPQNGKKRVEYSYCTERGELFSCIASTVEAAQDMCEQWMLRQERY